MEWADVVAAIFHCQSVYLRVSPWAKLPDQSSACTGSDSWHLLWPWIDQVMTWQEWPHSVFYQHTTYSEVESCMMPDLQSKVQKVGLVSKSVGANALSDS